MMFWITLGLMLLAACIVVTWPIYRFQQRLSLVIATTVIGITALSVLVYGQLGTPNASSVPPEGISILDMVASLDARLRENPDDLAGWKMLGRSYIELRQLPNAIEAFEKALEIEGSGNADTLLSLGEAVFMNDQSSINGRAGQLFESAIALAPAYPKALFYGGLSAAQRGETLLAADRWEALLAVGPPSEIDDTLRQGVAKWRGEQAATMPAVQAQADAANSVISIHISISESAAASIKPSSTVFVIARDPEHPSPPLAVAKRMLDQLNGAVALSDADAMVPGRVPSAYEQLEIVVRISASGQPIAQTGDWFGQGLIRPAQGASITITVDQQVP